MSTALRWLALVVPALLVVLHLTVAPQGARVALGLPLELWVRLAWIVLAWLYLLLFARLVWRAEGEE